MFVYLVNDSLV